MGIVVENPGVLTTIQDKGRYGYEQFGVSPSGPMDLESFQIANILVGNSRDLSALEATMLGPTLRFTQDNIIAVTGGDMMPLLDEKPLPMNQAVLVKAGSVLKLRAARTGCRTYVAFAGGLDVPEVMGSRATGVQNKVGGLEGRKLAKGDEISFLAPKTTLPRMESRRTDHPMPAGNERVLRVILGPQDDAFTPKGIDTFLGQPYHVTNDFDRMGCRLDGPVIEHKVDGNIISDGMVTGAIQVPTSGLPIIMLAERQTVGGYTKIATVITADLPVIGQCRPGDVIRFQSVTVSQAHQLWREMQQQLNTLDQNLNAPAPQAQPSVQAHQSPVYPATTLPGPVRRYRITVNGKVYETSIQVVSQ